MQKTNAEKKLEVWLKIMRFDYTYKKKIHYLEGGCFHVDFLVKKKVAVQIDDYTKHAEKRQRVIDKKEEELLKKRRIHTVRFTKYAILQGNPTSIIEKIKEYL